jgi:Na+/proline symporter
MSYYLIIQISIPLFIGMFTKFGNRWGAMSGMIAGSLVAIGFTIKWIDAIPQLGGLTAGVVGLIVNFVVFIVVSAVTGQSETEKNRVKELFLEALPPVKRIALGLPPVLGRVVPKTSDTVAATSDREIEI